MMFKVDSAMGNYLSAIDHLMMNKQLDDSMLTAQKMRQVEEYKVKYETEKRTANCCNSNRPFFNGSNYRCCIRKIWTACAGN
ncbi:hypothetical protein MKQ70_11965 [Chitinophaga sedimenti]|uniref:hypothetical protein n=1 Tax=Chitinophaga sedimenti TaxID=2033606 RepID=UPI00200492CE|nr:hypothetical protein [Chitinophaga sedimenti]MCK7555691.1 hypothetical protein [Chitinophaga sedimenti]